MKTVSLKLDPKEAKEEVSEGDAPSPPAYPYGTCLHLDGDELAKLGIADLPKPGTKFAVAGTAEVTGISMRQNQGGEDYQSVDLQLVELGLEAAGKEKTASAALYGEPKPAASG